MAPVIVVRVELWPHGMELERRTLGVATIANDRTGTRETGNYRVELSRFDSKAPWRKGQVEGFPRLELGPWDLLLWALVSTIGARSLRGRGIGCSGDGLKRSEVEEIDRNLEWQKAKKGGPPCSPTC